MSESKKRPRNSDPYLSVREAAEWISVSQEVIYDRVRRREIQSIRIGTRIIRIRLSALEAWWTEETAKNAG